MQSLAFVCAWSRSYNIRLCRAALSLPFRPAHRSPLMQWHTSSQIAARSTPGFQQHDIQFGQMISLCQCGVMKDQEKRHDGRAKEMWQNFQNRYGNEVCYIGELYDTPGRARIRIQCHYVSVSTSLPTIFSNTSSSVAFPTL